jgi:DHA2 family multidrug resistance protein
MLNLCRQLGGSFGIAILSTYLDDMRRYHRVDLSDNIYPSNPLLQQRLHALESMFMARGYDLHTAQHAALAMVYDAIQRQAATMGFNDGFLLIGMATVVVIPMVFLLRSGRKPVAAAEMAH